MSYKISKVKKWLETKKHQFQPVSKKSGDDALTVKRLKDNIYFSSYCSYDTPFGGFFLITKFHDDGIHLSFNFRNGSGNQIVIGEVCEINDIQVLMQSTMMVIPPPVL